MSDMNELQESVKQLQEIVYQILADLKEIKEQKPDKQEKQIKDKKKTRYENIYQHSKKYLDTHGDKNMYFYIVDGETLDESEFLQDLKDKYIPKKERKPRAKKEIVDKLEFPDEEDEEQD